MEQFTSSRFWRQLGCSSTQIGTGWNEYKFLFFGPDSFLYAVRQDGSFWKGFPPTYAEYNWGAHAMKIGNENSGWTEFKFLFFGPDSFLYAVRQDGSFWKGTPPTHAGENWLRDRAIKIGDEGWADFKFLF